MTGICDRFLFAAGWKGLDVGQHIHAIFGSPAQFAANRHLGAGHAEAGAVQEAIRIAVGDRAQALVDALAAEDDLFPITAVAFGAGGFIEFLAASGVAAFGFQGDSVDILGVINQAVFDEGCQLLNRGVIQIGRKIMSGIG